jgi:Prokaryotic membrane lipoprotein lipid attachment site
MMRRPFVTIVAALAVAGCSTADDPNPGVPESALHFLTPDPGAPGFAVDTLRLYAVVGQDRSAVLYYRDSVPFATFDIPAGALTRDATGAPLAAGDSLLITVAIADSSRLIVGFQPAGLAFSNGHPAQLTLSYAHAHNNLSPSNESSLSLWRQENPGEPWHRVSSNTRKDVKTVSGRVDGFTVYATAY